MPGLNSYSHTGCNTYQVIEFLVIPSSQKVNFCVPQGSDLGPFLPTLRINDLHNPVRFSSPFPFAHDTSQQKSK